jgi:hypothetical protein
LKNKSKAIREVLRDDPSYSNKQVKDIIRHNHDIEVSDSHVINLFGPQKERLLKGPAGKTRLKAGEKMLDVCGSVRDAVTTLHVIDDKRRQ